MIAVDQDEVDRQFARTEDLVRELTERLHRECHEGHPANVLTALEATTVYILHSFAVPTIQFADRVGGLRGRMFPAEPAAMRDATLQPERAACIHCKKDVCAIGDVDAIRLHSTTCIESPVVKENRELRADKAELMTDLISRDREIERRGDLIKLQAERIKALELQVQGAAGR